jgi:SSS family solute:Na+ symporter
MTNVYHWMACIAYCLGMVCIGWWIRNRIRRDQGEQVNYEFWIAKRQLPGWRLAMSLTAGWLMLGWIGFGMSQIYSYGVTGLWILPIPWLILCVIIIFMVPFVRRVASVSLPQAIQKRYGYSARVLLALLSFFVFIAWTQAELFMGGKLMAAFLLPDLRPEIAAPICMAIKVAPIIIYVCLGGFRANVATDVAQFALMAPFMIILAVVAYHGADVTSGGNIVDAISKITPPSVAAAGAQGQSMNLWFLGWLFPIVLLVGYLPGWMCEQDLVIRLQAAVSTREARKAAIWGLVLIGAFVIVLPAIIAFCAMVVYPPDGSSANGEFLKGDALNICTALIAKLPVWLSVFMFLGILACQMSTVDTFANVSALALAYDLVEPVLVKRRLSPHGRLMFAKGLSVFTLLASLGCGIITQSLNDVYYISSGVLSACIAVPAIFIFWRRTTLPAVMVAAGMGFVGTIATFWFEWHYLSSDANSPHYYMNVLPSWLQGSFQYNYVAVGVVLSLVSIVAVSLVTGPARPEQLAALEAAPVDDYGKFVAQTSVQASSAQGTLVSK